MWSPTSPSLAVKYSAHVNSWGLGASSADGGCDGHPNKIREPRRVTAVGSDLAGPGRSETEADIICLLSPLHAFMVPRATSAPGYDGLSRESISYKVRTLQVSLDLKGGNTPLSLELAHLAGVASLEVALSPSGNPEHALVFMRFHSTDPLTGPPGWVSHRDGPRWEGQGTTAPAHVTGRVTAHCSIGQQGL